MNLATLVMWGIIGILSLANLLIVIFDKTDSKLSAICGWIVAIMGALTIISSNLYQVIYRR